MMRAAIVDDEALARSKLRRLLAKHSDVTVVLEADCAREAVRMIQQESPELLFLDIDLPDQSGFEVLSALLEPVPFIVFVTAYSEHAVRAFDVHAVDYLLKPFDEQRLTSALDHVRQRRTAALPVRLESLLNALSEAHGPLREVNAASGCQYPERLPVRDGYVTTLLSIQEIDWIGAADNYVELHVGQRTYLRRETLSVMEARLDPRLFTRIHRGTIVNDRKVRAVRRELDADWEAILEGGATLAIGRTYRGRLVMKWRLVDTG